MRFYLANRRVGCHPSGAPRPLIYDWTLFAGSGMGHRKDIRGSQRGPKRLPPGRCSIATPGHASCDDGRSRSVLPSWHAPSERLLQARVCRYAKPATSLAGPCAEPVAQWTGLAPDRPYLSCLHSLRDTKDEAKPGKAYCTSRRSPDGRTTT